MALLWASAFNTDLSSWLLGFALLFLGFSITCLALWCCGSVLRIGQFWPSGLVGIYWQRNAFKHSWPQAALVVTLLMMILAVHITVSFSELMKEPLNKTTDNFFAINLPLDPDLQLEHVAFLKQYPLLRPKLVSIDGEHVKQSKTDKRGGREGVYRPLNSILSNEIPYNAPLQKGSWPVTYDQSEPYPLLIEASFAKKLGITLGSLLEFDIAGHLFYGKAAAIHQAHWQSMQPNFFVIFPKNSLDSYLESTLISGYANPAYKHEIFRTIATSYPSTTFFDTDDIKLILSKMINPILYGCYFLVGLFMIAMLLFSTFIKRLYPIEMLPFSLKTQLMPTNIKLIDYQLKLLESIFLSIFIILFCQLIFSFADWSWLCIDQLSFSYYSLFLSVLSIFAVLLGTQQASTHRY
jgi:putative ABC transport system permease protein